ncbi:phosphoadenosine phosphosulfate reductase domain-containing protein [Chroococcidiopsis sp.]|uniref:phosphoadenosine phosphosulfate reductase domain-containing protein n=1 Tax=Chroococcidiopsis sp. TaxID=3088168 RepID=UPI003F39556F
MPVKQHIDKSVYEMSLERIHLLYDRFDTVVVSFSGGKDSTVCFNLALQVATERNRLPLDVCFIDEECLTPETEEYLERVRSRQDVRFAWVCVPVKHRNACSRTQPYWYPWHPDERSLWVRQLPAGAITSIPGFQVGMNVPDIMALLYPPKNGNVACIRGIRTAESIRRLQSVTKREVDNWICQNATGKYGNYYPCSPIYDWSVSDVWVAPQQFLWDYNRHYDIQAMAGISKNLQRVTPPFGEEPLNGLWQFATCWPELWERMLLRVDGVATAWRYALTDLYGTSPKEPPPGMSYRDWCYSLIELYEPEDKAQIAASVTQMIKLHRSKTKRSIPETEADPVSGLSWKWLAKCINQGDLKGRKAGQLLKHAQVRCDKLGITYEEALKLDDNGL